MIFVILLGLLIGISSALLGLGGNILIVPLLPLIHDLPFREIVATGIFTVLFVCLVNVIAFYRKGLIDLKRSAILIIPTSVSSYLSSHFSESFSEGFLQALLLTIIGLMFIRLNLKIERGNKPKYANLLLVIGGLVSGFMAGLVGIGSGVILGPMLLGFNLTDDKKVSPTINLMILIACLFSTFNYLSFSELTLSRSGSVHFDLALMMFIPALITSKLGRKYNQTINPITRRRIVSVALLLIFAKELLL